MASATYAPPLPHDVLEKLGGIDSQRKAMHSLSYTAILEFQNKARKDPVIKDSAKLGRVFEDMECVAAALIDVRGIVQEIMAPVKGKARRKRAPK